MPCWSPVFRARLGGALLVTVVVGLAGCGDNLPPVFEVKGKVVFKDGKGNVRKLRDWTVQFQNVADEKDMPGATIEGDGNFVAASQRGTKAVNGIKEGTYKVRLLNAAMGMIEESEKAPANLVNPRYLSFKTTPLEYTIHSGSNFLTVEIEGGR
jgi:hypothetical protein